MKITIDTNILIDFEQNEKDSIELLSFHNNKATLYISCATAYDHRKIPSVET